MATVSGRLTADGSPSSVAGYGVSATFEEKISFSDSEDAVFVSAVRTTTAGADGGFPSPLPDGDGWREPLVLRAAAPNGTVVGSREVAAGDVGSEVTLPVVPVPPTSIVASDDPTLGRSRRLTGRVLDPDGTGGAAQLLVVIWAVPDGGAEADAFPLGVAVRRGRAGVGRARRP